VATFDLSVERHWGCPNCDYTRVTYKSGPQAVIHRCRGLRGLIAPLVEDGVRAKVYARERDDYVGENVVQVDGEGRPIMSIVTERADGQDCRVLAPLAAVSGVTRGGA
jgi:hypothetical protein